MFRFSRTLESCERSNGATRSCVVRWPSICGHIYCVILKDIVSLRTPAKIIEYLCTRLYDIEENNRHCPNVCRIREERDNQLLFLDDRVPTTGSELSVYSIQGYCCLNRTRRKDAVSMDARRSQGERACLFLFCGQISINTRRS